MVDGGGIATARRGELDRFHDLLIARAAAQVACQPLLDLGAGRVRPLVEDLEPMVRLQAISALGNLGARDPAARPAAAEGLAKAMQDGWGNNRTNALHAMASMGSAGALVLGSRGRPTKS